MTTPPSSRPALLTVRSLLIFLAALFIGGTIGALTFSTSGVLAVAIIAGLTAAGCAIPVLDRLVE